MKVAAIDCGTNSIRLLIAELPEPGRDQPTMRDIPAMRDIRREMRIVRLGQGVDRTRRFHPDALARTFEAVGDYAELIAQEGVQRVRFAATSATRDAANREEFFAGVRALMGVTPEVISGEEEAELAFAGAARVIGPDAGNALVVDLGGGSTEFVYRAAGHSPVAVSADVGSVRITERYLASDPPTAAEIRAAREDARAAIAEASATIPLGQVATLVGTAGTIITVTAHALGLETYDPQKINGAELSAGDIEAACTDLLQRSRKQRATLGVVHPGRIDVIGAGALIWREIVSEVVRAVRRESREGHRSRELGPVITSEHDILDGLALSLARQAS